VVHPRRSRGGRPLEAAPTFLLDRLLGKDPDTDGYLAELLELKSQLTSTIASTLVPLLAPGRVVPTVGQELLGPAP
jgi:hypothetical protein